MPIENLTGDSHLDWASRGAAAVVVYDLAGAKQISAREVNSLSDAQSMQASRLLEGYFFERNGRAGIRAMLEDLTKTKTLESWDIDGDASAGLLPLVNQLAGKLSSDARAFGTSNASAFQLYGAALGAKDPNGAEQALQQATAADPGFAAAYLEQAKLLNETGDRELARHVTEAAERARLDSIDRADLEYDTANASGDAGGRMKALEALAAVTPAHADVFQQLGEIKFARRQFPQSVMEYRAAAQLDPEESRIWNELGYALAWNKDLKGASEALDRYQRVAPTDINAVDSQGEVHYMLGDFEAASSYFGKAGATIPADVVKEAEARLMLGDRKGADVLFVKHLDSRASAPFEMAQWEYLTGRKSAGMSRMEKLAAGLSGDPKSVALSQLAIWTLQQGDKKAAAKLVDQAAGGARSPQVRGIVSITGTVVAGNANSDSKMVNGFALMLANKAGEALPLLEELYRETNPSADGQVRTLLAWAYVETGAVEKAASLVDVYPLPLSSGDPLFASLTFPRFLAVRAAVLEREGKAEEAKKARALYSMYAGTTK
jgi:tetratricopeptide (TPR) repeat protein